VRSMDDPKQLLLANVWAHDFLGIEGDLQKLAWRQRSERARFTYGYALTCHKSQGSEYENVLVIDQSSVFRENAVNWLYTAVTRASKKLVLVRQ
jgi:exodeoxyribonuclease V